MIVERVLGRRPETLVWGVVYVAVAVLMLKPPINDWTSIGFSACAFAASVYLFDFAVVSRLKAEPQPDRPASDNLGSSLADAQAAQLLARTDQVAELPQPVIQKHPPTVLGKAAPDAPKSGPTITIPLTDDTSSTTEFSNESDTTDVQLMLLPGVFGDYRNIAPEDYMRFWRGVKSAARLKPGQHYPKSFSTGFLLSNATVFVSGEANIDEITVTDMRLQQKSILNVDPVAPREENVTRPPRRRLFKVKNLTED
jgi:hypothetical protein